MRRCGTGRAIMSRIPTPADCVAEVIVKFSISARLLSEEVALQIRRDIANKYTRHHRKVDWQDLIDHASLQDENGWESIDAYIDGHSFLLLFDEESEKSVFEFEMGSSLADVIGECAAFDFYVTDAAYSFLICFNHHDFLIGAGNAMPWILRLGGHFVSL